MTNHLTNWPREPIGRRRFLRLSLGTAATVAGGSLLAACGGSGSSKNTLTVANWEGYGSNLAWVLSEFKKRTGATVVHQYYNSEQQLINLLQNGGVGQIDVALPNLQFAPNAKSKGLLATIDTSRLRHYNDIYPKLREEPTLHKDGAPFAIPWVWGSNNMWYDKSAGYGLDSWAALWDPKYKGKVGWVNDGTASVLIAGMYLRENPYNPDLSKVTSALTALIKNVHVMYSATGDFDKAVLNGSVSLGQGFSYATGALIEQGKQLTAVVPKEGAVGWQDNWSIVKNAPNPDLAYEWINFMTSPEFQQRWAEDPNAGSPAPSNAKTVSQLNRATIVRVQAYPAQLDNLVMQKAMPQSQLSDWLSLWENVQAT